jgi:alpha-L-fucosidase
MRFANCSLRLSLTLRGRRSERAKPLYHRRTFGEGGSRGQRGELNIRFTVQGDVLYAIILGNWPGERATIMSLKSPGGKIESITMLGSHAGELKHTQDAEGLTVTLPSVAPCKYGYTLKIAGIKTNPPTTTVSGNPK